MFEFFKSKSNNETDDDEVSFQIELLKARAFPEGDQQIELETSRLHLALNGKLTISDTRNLLIWTKVRLLVGKDDSLELMKVQACTAIARELAGFVWAIGQALPQPAINA